MKIEPSAVFKSAVSKTGFIWGALKGLQLFERMGLSPSFFCLISFTGISIAEFVRAQHAAKEANLEDYLQSPNPSPETFRYLVENPFILQELIDQGANLTKTDPKGNSLLYAATAQYDFDPAMFELLFTQVSWPFEEILKCLVHMAEFREGLLSYVVEKKWILGASLKPADQMALWMAIQSKKGAELLKEMGCDPNVRDATGKTPLLKTAAGEYYGGRAVKQVERLLAIGADSNTFVIENGVQKNGLRLAREAQPKDPDLIQFLESPFPISIQTEP